MMSRLRSKALLLTLVFLWTACDKDNTDHPRYGKIVSLTTDWTDRGEGVDIPAVYTVDAGGYTTTLSGSVNSIDNLFEPGRYSVYVYNLVNGVIVSDNHATADYTTGISGWFFTGKESVMVDKDKDYAVTVLMQQQVRQLTLELELSGDSGSRLTGIDATLSGVAGAWNIDTNGPLVGSAVTVPFAFTKIDDRYSATIRLLGMIGSAQELSLTLRFTGGNPASYTVTSDLSGLLAGFNNDKKKPVTLSAIMVVTPTQGGFTSVVSDWASGGLSEGVAE